MLILICLVCARPSSMPSDVPQCYAGKQIAKSELCANLLCSFLLPPLNRSLSTALLQRHS